MGATTKTTNAVAELAREMRARGLTKREAAERIVAAVRAALPELDAAGVKAISWDFYKQVSLVCAGCGDAGETGDFRSTDGRCETCCERRAS